MFECFTHNFESFRARANCFRAAWRQVEAALASYTQQSFPFSVLRKRACYLYFAKVGLCFPNSRITFVQLQIYYGLLGLHLVLLWRTCPTPASHPMVGGGERLSRFVQRRTVIVTGIQQFYYFLCLIS